MPVSHSHQFLCVSAEAADDDRQPLRLGRIGDVPHFMADVAEATQQVDLALVGPRQLAAVAHAHHLGAARFSLPAARPECARDISAASDRSRRRSTCRCSPAYRSAG